MNKEQIESRLYNHAHNPETISVSISGDEYTIAGVDNGTGNTTITLWAHGKMWSNLTPIVLDRTKSGLNAGTMGGTGDGQLLYAFFNNTASRFLGFGLLSLTDDPTNYYSKYYHVKTYPLVAKYNTNAGQSIGSSGYTIINYEDKIYDTHDCVDVGASWKFTAPYPGYYQIKACIYVQDTTSFTGAEYIGILAFVNGSSVGQLEIKRPYSGEDYPFLNGALITYLSKGDYVDIQVTHNLGSPLTLRTIETGNYVNISLIR